MMIIWHLDRPAEEKDYGVTCAMVIVARTEQEARHMACNRMAYIATWARQTEWLGQRRTTCKPIGTASTGAVAEIVCVDMWED